MDIDKSLEGDVKVVSAAYFLRKRFINLKFSFPVQILEKDLLLHSNLIIKE